MGAKSQKGKQSALKQLKSNLNNVGLIGPKSQISKKKKKTKIQKPGENQKHRTEIQKQLQELQKSMNPFGTQKGRSKQDVLGVKKQKGQEGNPLVSRQRGLEKRKKTLLVEIENRNRTGMINDRRFGENNENLSVEEKMLERFTKERLKRSRNGSLYNLDDGDGDGEDMELTHLGQSLADIDDFNDVDLNVSDEEDPGTIDRDTVNKLHFGGFESDEDAGDGTEWPPKKKSKDEVMKEIIAKSKMYKYERQKAKEEDNMVFKDLDDNFESLRSLLLASANKAIDSDEAKKELSKPMPKAADVDDDGENEKSINYDRMVHELVHDRRAKPQDRLKTEEELALEEKERLEKAERHRLRRMNGQDSDTDPESDEDEDEDLPAPKLKRAPQADDLDGSFVAEDMATSHGLGKGLQSHSDEDEDEGDDDESEDESESESDDGSDLEDGGDSEEDAEERKSKISKRALGKKAAGLTDKAEAIPYTFKMPENYEDWVEIVQDYNLDQQLVVIQRLRTLYHPKLSPQNKPKLLDLFTVLLDHLAVLTEQDPPVPATIIDTIVRHIGELAPLFPLQVAETCRQKLVDFQKQVIKLSGRHMQGDDSEENEPFPLASQLAHIRLFASLFSSSDKYHPVVTPMVTAISQYLSQLTIRTYRDACSGIILCGVLHEVHRLSRRFIPEALNYLLSLVCAIGAKSCPSTKRWPGYFPISSNQATEFEKFALDPNDTSAKSESEARSIRWSDFIADEEPESLSASQKLSLLKASVAMLHTWSDCYFSVSAFIEAFNPTKTMLSSILEKYKNLPSDLHKQIKSTLEHIESQLASSQKKRQPLKLQHHKPIAIQTVAPKFEENYSLDAHYDPDRDRSELQKLRRLHKKEQRGAIRELRRDAQFISAVQLQKQKEKDAVYDRKMKSAWGVLENDEGDLKKLDKLRELEKKGKA